MTLSEAMRRYPGAETFMFGDGPALSARLIALVRDGRKRATCSALAEFASGEAPPEVGRCDIVLDHRGVPQLVVRTVELVPVRFCEMSEAMALAEGEDDTLEGWRAGHERYYRRAGVFALDMQLIWERFDLVEDLGGTADVP